MAKFIRVIDNRNGKIYINAELILWMKEVKLPNEEYTFIQTMGDNTDFRVKETIQELKKLMEG